MGFIPARLRFGGHEKASCAADIPNAQSFQMRTRRSLRNFQMRTRRSLHNCRTAVPSS